MLHQPTTASAFARPRALRLLLATAALALAAGMAQTAMAQPHRGHGMGGEMGGEMGGPRMVERMLDAANASADQRAEVQKIMAAAQADMKAQHEATRALREQSQALFAQPNIDARAAETLRQQMSAQHDVASKRMLATKLAIANVLTADQRKTLADRMAQRRSMMERHHAERRQLDGSKP